VVLLHRRISLAYPLSLLAVSVVLLAIDGAASDVTDGAALDNESLDLRYC